MAGTCDQARVVLSSNSLKSLVCSCVAITLGLTINTNHSDASGCETLHSHAIATVAAVGIGVVKRAHRLTSTQGKS
jgi:hypothetical protein